MNIKPTFTRTPRPTPESVSPCGCSIRSHAPSATRIWWKPARASRSSPPRCSGCPDPDEPIRRIEAAAKAEGREATPEEQTKIRAIESKPETIGQRVARNKLDHRIGLIINRELKPAYIRASLVSIEGFEVEGKARGQALGHSDPQRAG